MCYKMDGPRDHDTRQSQKEKDRYHMTLLTRGIQNTTQVNIPTKQKQTHRHRGQTCSSQGGGRSGERGSSGLAEANYYM